MEMNADEYICLDYIIRCQLRVRKRANQQDSKLRKSFDQRKSVCTKKIERVDPFGIYKMQ